MNFKKIYFSLVFISLFSGLFAETIKPVQKEVLKPVERIKSDNSKDNDSFEPTALKAIEEEQTSVTIETDVSGVDVYLNGIYQGKTNLVIEDLTPGFYLLELKKHGYEKETFFIRVRKGYSLKYSFHMRRIFGTVSVRNIPENAIVTVPGAFNTRWSSVGSGYRDCDYDVEPGNQEVKVSCFGYKDYATYVRVYAYEVSPIYVELEEAPFELSDYSCNKTSFNPNYKGRLGECSVSFRVTAPEVAKVYVCDVAGNTIWERQLPEFNTWNQSFTWNGRNNEGEIVPDGSYSVNISVSSYERSAVVEIDSTISYPNMSVTLVGGGIGNVPAVVKENTPFVLLNCRGGAVLSDFNMYSGQIAGNCLFNFAKHCEIGLNFACYPGMEYGGAIGTSVKVYNTTPVKDATLCYGGLLRYGYDDYDYYEHRVVDAGIGFGVAGLFGVDFDKFYIGYAGQYLIGYWCGLFGCGDNLISNGICVSLKPNQSLRVNGWGTLNSADTVFGSVNCGAEISFMPESSAFIISGNCSSIICEDKNIYLSFGIGLSYLF